MFRQFTKTMFTRGDRVDVRFRVRDNRRRRRYGPPPGVYTVTDGVIEMVTPDMLEVYSQSNQSVEHIHRYDLISITLRNPELRMQMETGEVTRDNVED